MRAADRVAVVAPNVPALVVSLFAAWQLDAVAVPLSARLRDHDLTAALEVAAPAVVVSLGEHQGFSCTDLVDRLGLAHLVVDPAGHVLAPGSLPIRREPGPETPAGTGLLLFTSGTTGVAKAALVSHGRELAGSTNLADALALSERDTTVLVVAASHAFGLTCLLSVFRSGGHGVLVDSTFSPEPMVRALRDHHATVLHGSPTLFGTVERIDPWPPDLRRGLVAGARCPPELVERLAARRFDLLDLYGMTEIGAAALGGRPLPGYELRVDDGEVQVRGRHVTTGYFRHPDPERFDGPWLRTGDLGELEADGRLRIVGRRKDLAKVAGFTVAPAEVETVLAGHPQVADAAVVAVAHASLGEALRAFVVLAPGEDLSTGALLGFARRRLAGYKLPYSIEIVRDLPRLPSGKPDRVALRSRPQT